MGESSGTPCPFPAYKLVDAGTKTKDEIGWHDFVEFIFIKTDIPPMYPTSSNSIIWARSIWFAEHDLPYVLQKAEEDIEERCDQLRCTFSVVEDEDDSNNEKFISYHYDITKSTLNRMHE